MENDRDPLRMLTLAEAAELMHVSKRTLSRMIDRKDFPGCKVGGQWRVRESELAKWIHGLNEL
jgi:excisionase family DNA binding protein